MQHHFTSKRTGSTIAAVVPNAQSSPEEVHAALEKKSAEHETKFAKTANLRNDSDVRRRPPK